MLDMMQDKHRFMVRALTHRYRRDKADDFLADMRGRIDKLRSMLADERSLAAVLVTRAEPVVEAESRRYIEHLEALHVRIAGIIVNAGAPGTERYKIHESIPHSWIPLREPPSSPPPLHQSSTEPFPR